ncbi:mucin-binding protein [Weissella confusa]|uniref:mucin-binding protein n=1 Tax=Weissella confusa TaxID=1583 RepID=UPI0018F2531F|nr:hypothetical protein [Weissella confusa]MBJ7686738.1 MucBP domain-containing protein [Weissella confusa]MBJ7697084.1 MucBP domain-containing protein [Weissella confusa]
MKVIKTNNFIKPLIVLIGVAATLMMPSQMAFAADEMIHPGDHKVSQNTTPDASQFDGVHSITDTARGTNFAINPFPQPRYDATNKRWTFIDGEHSISGAGSAAFERPLSLSSNFDIKTTAKMTSDGEKNWVGWYTTDPNEKFSTGFVGLVLSTSQATDFSKSQKIGDYRLGDMWGMGSHAGYALENVAWQIALGTQAKPDGRGTQDILRQSIAGAYSPLNVMNRQKGAVDATYTAHYDANIRKLSVTTDKGLSQTIDVPKELKRLYVGQMATINGNAWGDHDSVTLSDISGTYDTTTTTVRFVDKDGNPLADDAKIDSIIGAKISISGSAEENWLAPDIPHATLAGTAADRTITTTEDESKNVITVRYDAVSGKLPVKIVDDTDNANKIPDTSLPVVIGQTYNYSDKDLAKVIPANTHIVSLEKNSGTVVADDQNDVTNEPMVIHVAHDTKSEDVTFSRTVHYEGPASLKVPDDNIQKTTVTRTTDNYTGKTTTNKPAAWLDVKTPDIKGYEPDIKKVHWDSIDANPSETLSQTVTYKGVFKVYAPDTMDFGTITIGDKYYQGKAIKAAKQVHGSLYVAHTATTANHKWRLTAKLDQNFMVGKPTLQIAYGQYEINSDYETEIANQSDSSTDGITDTAINENTPGMVGLKLDRSAQQANVQAGKDYHGTITWTLGTVPA